MEILVEYEMVIKVLLIIQAFKVETTILGLVENWFETKWQAVLMFIPFGLTMYFIWCIALKIKELK